jgi:hypothetical protein
MNSLADKQLKHFIGRKKNSGRLGLVKIKVENGGERGRSLPLRFVVDCWRC